MVSSALLSSLLAISLSGILTHGQLYFHLEVIDNQPNSNQKMYLAHAPPRGVLLGAMTQLADSNRDFTFTTSYNKDYGVYLESVNGLFGNNQQHTFWALLAQKANGTLISTDVGISCYIPQANEKVILRYTKW